MLKKTASMNYNRSIPEDKKNMNFYESGTREEFIALQLDRDSAVISILKEYNIYKGDF